MGIREMTNFPGAAQVCRSKNCATQLAVNTRERTQGRKRAAHGAIGGVKDNQRWC